MVKNQTQFDERLRLISRKHRAMSRGYVTQIQSDGLIIAKPIRRTIHIPARAVVLFVLAFFGFKAFLVANLGSQTYDDRLSRLNEGTIVEQAGAFVMQADPVTMYAAKQIGPILR